MPAKTKGLTPQDLTINDCRVYLTVATLVDRGLPPELESLLGSKKPEFNEWKLFRPSQRYGVHPDFVFDIGQVSSPNACTFELHSHRTFETKESENTKIEPSDAAWMIAGVVPVFAFRKKYGLPNKVREAWPWPSIVDVMLRLLPSGVATLTLRIHFNTIKGEQLDALLKCLDPRRRSKSPGVNPPDLLGVLRSGIGSLRASLLEQLENDSNGLAKDWLWPIARSVTTTKISESGVKWGMIVEKAPKDAFGGAFDVFADYMRGELELSRRPDLLARQIVALKQDLLVDQGGTTASTLEQAADSALKDWQLIEAVQRPYVFIAGTITNEGIWSTADADLTDRARLHRLLFHVITGPYVPYGSDTLRIPEVYRAGDGTRELLRSHTWSDDAIVFHSARGSGFFVQQKNGGKWEPDQVEAYENSAIDVIEHVVGTWAALGIIEIKIDRATLRLGPNPLSNWKVLHDLAAIRRTLARLTGDRLLYRIEGSSLRPLADGLRVDLGLDRLQQDVHFKLTEVKELHELLLQLEAVRQIREEHDHEDR